MGGLQSKIYYRTHVENTQTEINRKNMCLCRGCDTNP